MKQALKIAIISVIGNLNYVTNYLLRNCIKIIRKKIWFGTFYPIYVRMKRIECTLNSMKHVFLHSLNYPFVLQPLFHTVKLLVTFI